MSEKEALLSFYFETSGNQWNISTSWASNLPLRNWYGIGSLISGDIDSLILIDNNLEGNITKALRQLAGLHRLRVLSLRGNNISGIFNSKEDDEVVINKYHQLLKKNVNNDEKNGKFKRILNNNEATEEEIEDSSSLSSLNSSYKIKNVSPSTSSVMFSYHQDKVKINSSIFPSIKLDPFFPTLTTSSRHLSKLTSDNYNTYSSSKLLIHDKKINKISNHGQDQGQDSISSSSLPSISNTISSIIIPHFFHKLSEYLEQLDLSWNKIEGELPLDLFLLVKLKIFRVSFNKLTGDLEKLPFENLKNLEVLEVNNNNFYGNSPSLWLKQRCHNVYSLNIDNNQFNS